MKHLIDLFTPQELLHIVAVSNRMNILSTPEKKYLIAVRMGTKYVDGSYSLSDREKDKFLKIFFQFMQQYPSFYHCEKDPCPICSRLRDLKEDFEKDQKSEEFQLLMAWFTKSQAHYGVSDISADGDELPVQAATYKEETPEETAIECEEAPAVPERTVRPVVRRSVSRSVVEDTERKTVKASTPPTPPTPVAPKIPEAPAKPQPEKVQRTENLESRSPVWSPVPLWTLNPDHPLGEALNRLARTNIDFLDDQQLRDFGKDSSEVLKELASLLMPGSGITGERRGTRSEARYA